MLSPLRSLLPFAASVVLVGLAPAAPQADVTPPQVLSGPFLKENPVRFVRLAAVVDLITDEPTQVILGFYDGVRSWRVLAEPQFRTVHHVAAAGMKPNRLHSIQVILRDAAGNVTVVPNPLSFQTPPLPPGFPPLQVTVPAHGALEPGYTLFCARYDTPGGGPFGSWIVMLDELGEVVWFYRNVDLLPTNIERTRSGTFVFHNENVLYEIDLLGNLLGSWYASNLGTHGAPPGSIAVATDTFHHEVTELPAGEQGDFLALSSELRMLPNYPASEIDPTITDAVGRVVGDVIVEFKRDGTIVREAKLLDILDPYRVVYDSVNLGYWNATYGGTTRDWAHSNAVTFDPSDDTWVISSRHQDAVTKIRRSDHSIVWILGPHERWVAPWTSHLLTPASGPFEWQYHQHAVKVNAAGNVIFFDNGNRRVIPPLAAPPPQQWYSRAVEYRVDPLTMSVRQMWAYGGLFEPAANQFFSAFLSEAQHLSQTGNVLVTDGGAPNFTLGVNFARIAEVKHSRPAEVLMEVRIEDQSQQRNWTVYRSERLPSIYP